MEAAILFTFYVLGIFTGIIGTIVFTIYLGKRAIDRQKNQLLVDNQKPESVSSRMKKIKDMQKKKKDIEEQQAMRMKQEILAQVLGVGTGSSVSKSSANGPQ